MARIEVSERELIDRINQALTDDPTLATCRFSGVYKLQGIDDNGCNWSAGYFSAGEVPKEVVAQGGVAKVVELMQARYNIRKE